MLGPSERDDDRPPMPGVPRHEQCHIAGSPGQQRGQLFVGCPLHEELVGGVRQQELDVELRREPGQLHTRRARRERSGSGRDASALKSRPALLEPRGCGSKLGRVGNEPGQDDDTRWVAHERLCHGEQGVGSLVVRDRDEDRPFGRLRDTRGRWPRCVKCGVLPKDRSLQLLEGRARFDAELVDERPARVLVRVEGFGLPA
jgi:hypothetical protein